MTHEDQDGLQPSPIAPEEYATRARMVRERLKSRGLDAGLAYGTQQLPGDVQYLTGYDPQLEHAVVLVTPEHVVGLGGAEGGAMFADSGRYGTWRNLKTFEIPFQDYGDTEFLTWRDVLEEYLGGTSLRIALLSQSDVATKAVGDQLAEASIKLTDASDILQELRYRKSPAELSLFEESSRIASAALQAMYEAITPGTTELSVAAAADCVIKKMGASGYGFDTIVCSGQRINTVIGRASNKRLEPSEPVIIGACPRYEGYASTVGRTVFVGGPDRHQRAFLADGAEALSRAAAALIPGTPARNVDLAARNYLDSKNLKKYHMYGVGHGIGLSECLEPRTATAVSDYDLPSGIAMMLDVGLFNHPTYFGARHEDPYTIRHDGQVDRLTDVPLLLQE